MPQEVLLLLRCPVTDSYVRYMRKKTEFDELMHEAILQRLQQIEEEGEQAGNSTRVQQLRCFLCLEIMVKLSKCGALSQRFDRSWAGLTRLKKQVVNEREGLEADTLDRVLGGLRYWNMDQVQHSAETKTKRILLLIEESIAILRRSLSNGRGRPLRRIGKRLAMACYVAGEITSMRVEYAAMLVHTTEQQARRLWEQ